MYEALARKSSANMNTSRKPLNDLVVMAGVIIQTGTEPEGS